MNVSVKQLNAEISRRYGNVEDFLEVIRKAMSFTGTSQAELARRTGYNPSHVCRWLSLKEETQVIPSLETRMVIAETMEEIVQQHLVEAEM